MIINTTVGSVELSGIGGSGFLLTPRMLQRSKPPPIKADRSPV